MITLSNVFHKNQQALKDGFRYIINRGGTSSTKTWSILQLLTDIARKKKYKIDVIGQSVPHLKSGVINDMPAVCQEFGIVFDDKFNKSDKELQLEGSINFLSVDKLGKALGGRRDILFLNEANHIPWAIAEQLIIRTRIAVFIDFNPTNYFWVHHHIMQNEKQKCIEIVSTYKDNPCLEQSIIEALEARQGDNNFWRVYGRGEMGRAEGLIFTGFETQAEFDKEQFSKYRHGVDWGFSIDPFAYVRIALTHDTIYVCDEVYGRNLQNTATAEMIKQYCKEEPVYCDSAEPKSIEEYRTLGIFSYPCKKGQGSVETGIKFMQRYKIVIHRDCPNIANEFMNYAWKINKATGEPLNMPEDNFNHGIDACRYSLNDDIGGVGGVSLSFF